MIGQLTPTEIEDLLRTEEVGRIGCHAEGRTYVVPVAYAYDGECVYAHSRDGLKIRTMRANPNVCFEVDRICDKARWRSVVGWGVYEELYGAEEARARALFNARFPPEGLPDAALPVPVTHSDVDQRRTIFYRFRLQEKTGRFEG
jgi:uncharacterized protein